MKINSKQTTNVQVSKFVKTCDELVIGAMEAENHHYEGDRSENFTCEA